MRPTEGTILSVIRAAAEGAVKSNWNWYSRTLWVKYVIEAKVYVR